MGIVRFDQLKYDELVSVEQKLIDSRDRPKVTNKYRKLFFFLLREGIVRTLNKVKSKRNKELSLHKALTLITINHKGNLYVNYSTQTVKEPANFVVDNNFYPVSDTIKLDTIENDTIFNQFTYQKDDTLKSLAFEVRIDTEKGGISHEKGVFIYGLGDYSRVYVAPNIIKQRKSYCIDYNYQLSSYYQQKFGYDNFGLVPEDSYQELSSTKNPLAIIATYHSDHTRIAKEIFEFNPNALIFIEKPPCVSLEDIQILSDLYDQNAKIEIGYNRRFIPENQEIRDLIYDQQKVINISVKEILINDNHWYFWKNQGTRITGNLTHWLDLSVFWINGNPVEINVLSSPSKDETITVSVLFSEGSLVNITVSDKGNSLRGVQEQVEIRTEQETFVIEDYVKYTRVYSNGKKDIRKRLKRIKGHDAMYKHLASLYTSKNIAPRYSKADLIKSSILTYQVADMYRKDVRNSAFKKDLTNSTL